jgi:proteasome lid subunit RPN8/RPN11
MNLAISAKYLRQFINELRGAGPREIGGVLVGEHLGGDKFALANFSVQRIGGGHGHFERDPAEARQFVEDAIARAGGDPTKVNYLGEWHSHPSWSARPSQTDIDQMQMIVQDPEELATFSVLIIVAVRPSVLEMSATLFRQDQAPEAVKVQVVDDSDTTRWAMAPSEPEADSCEKECD